MNVNIARIRIAAILVLLIAVSFAGCHRSSGNGKKVIAVIPKGVSHFFWNSVEAGALAAGRDFGVDIRWKV